jgi:hypothetical protein
MLEQSVERFFQEIADKEQPQSRISIQQALRDGRARLRRRRLLRAVGTPALAAAAVLAIAVSSTGPPAGSGHTRPQPGTYGKLVEGAFDPSYLSIKFGWLPAGYYVTGGESSPGAEMLSAYRARGINLNISVYTLNECHVNERLGCPVYSTSNARRGPVIDGHRSWWLPEAPQQIALAWEYAPDSWAEAQQTSGPSGAANVVRIARAMEYGQHVPIEFASRFTSLSRGWRIIDVQFDATNDAAGPMPAGVYLASYFTIARLRTISPATPTGDTPGKPLIGAPTISVVRIPRQWHCNSLLGGTVQDVTIHGVQFTLSHSLQAAGGYIVNNIHTVRHVLSFLALCRGHLDGLAASVYETGVGRHPHLVFPPTAVIEHLQLLGTKPADWVTNPLP